MVTGDQEVLEFTLWEVMDGFDQLSFVSRKDDR